jgi:hypothetical protein
MRNWSRFPQSSQTDRLQPAQVLHVLLDEDDRVVAETVLPTLGVKLRRVRIPGKPHAKRSLRVGVVERTHGAKHQAGPFGGGGLVLRLEVVDELFDRPVEVLQDVQGSIELGQLVDIEAHVRGVGRDGRPEVGVVHAVPGCPVAAGGFPEKPAPTFAPAREPVFHEGDDLLDEVVGVVARPNAVNVLVPAQPRRAVRKSDNDRGHGAFGDQAVQALGDVLADGPPRRLAEAGPPESREVDEQGQVFAL